MILRKNFETSFQKFYKETSDGPETSHTPEKKEAPKTDEQRKAEGLQGEVVCRTRENNTLEGGLGKMGTPTPTKTQAERDFDAACLAAKPPLPVLPGDGEEDAEEMKRLRARMDQNKKKIEGAERQLAQAQIPGSPQTVGDIGPQTTPPQAGEKIPSEETPEQKKERETREFLTQNKTPADRLKALGITPESLNAGGSINIPAEKLPAGVTPSQIIPESVAALQVGDKTYTRVNGSRGGEFRDEQGNILKGEDLKGAKVDKTRTSEDLKRLTEAEQKGLEKYKDLDKYLAQRAKEKGINPDFFITAMKSKFEANLYGETPEEIKKAKEDTWKRENVDKEIDALANALSSNAEALKNGDVGAIYEAFQKVDPLQSVDRTKQALVQSGKTPAQAETMTRDHIQNNYAPNGTHGRRFSNYTEARDWASSMIGGAKAGELGSLSAEFESGAKGPMAINPNDNGKPSFGTYQLRADALKKFADQMGIKGSKEGEHETVFTEGNETEFAKNWKKKVQEVGAEAFKKKEHEFIKATHFDVMAKSLPFDVSKCSMTLQNVIWSISVQHGPGRTEVVTNALSQIGGNLTPGDANQEKKLIEAIYKVRTGMFPKEAGRYQREQKIAMGQMNAAPTGTANIPTGDIQSLPATVNPRTGVTQCLGTARGNAARLGVQIPSLPGDRSAAQLEDYFRSQGRMSQQPTGKVFQVFCESLKWNGKNGKPRYGHIATGFVQNGQAYVLDPYLMKTTRPVPFEQYKAHIISKGRGFNGVANLG